MSWTPHSKEALSNAGVNFGTGDSISGSPVIVYPNSDGTTGGSSYNYNYSSGDKYGGTPININTGNSAAGLQSLSATLGSGFEGLFDLIQQNTDKNNAWSAAQAQKQMDFQTRANQIAMDFNSLEAAKNRDWQEMMSNTAHQREIADLQAAGLNPVLSASGGNGASVGSGATASGVTSSGSRGDTDTSMNQALVSLYGQLISAQTQMYNANLSAQTNMAIAEKQVEASKYGAALAAGAQNYSADMSFKNAEAQREWNANHPSNPYQVITSDPVQQMAENWLDNHPLVKSIVNGVTGNKSSPSAKSRSTHK